MAKNTTTHSSHHSRVVSFFFGVEGTSPIMYIFWHDC